MGLPPGRPIFLQARLPTLKVAPANARSSCSAHPTGLKSSVTFGQESGDDTDVRDCANPEDEVGMDDSTWFISGDRCSSCRATSTRYRRGGGRATRSEPAARTPSRARQGGRRGSRGFRQRVFSAWTLRKYYTQRVIYLRCHSGMWRIPALPKRNSTRPPLSDNCCGSIA